jgi:fibronectin type 3 domain-containing protein
VSVLNGLQTLTAVFVDGQGVTLTWIDTSENATGFTIERQTGESGGYEQIAEVDANFSHYTDSAVNLETTYFYRVGTIDSSGDLAYSNEASATTRNVSTEDDSGVSDLSATRSISVVVSAESVPNSPQPLSAVLLDVQQVELLWSRASDNEMGVTLIIERKTGESGSYEQIAALDANVTDYIDSGVALATTYFYRVGTSGPSGDFAYSNPTSVTTGNIAAEDDSDGDNVSDAEWVWPIVLFENVPKDPQALSAVPLDDQHVELVWSPASDNEMYFIFIIERSTNEPGGYEQIASVGANVSSYIDVGLLSGTHYSYRVRASSPFGDSDYSNEASATTGSNTSEDNSGDGVAAGAGSAASAGTVASGLHSPQNLSALLLDAQQVALSWMDTSDNETGFTIERRTGDSADYVQIATVGADVPSYSDGALLPGTAYSYRVRAINAFGHSDYSNEASATTSALPPQGLASASAHFVALDTATQGTWKGSYGADGYSMINEAAKYPDYAQLTANASTAWIWASSSSDGRALQKESLSDRVAACWYSPSTFTVDLDLIDKQPHRAAFYCVDWNAGDRVQTIEVLDASTGAVLDSQTLSSFGEGAYLVWNLQGSVQIRFSRVAGENAVLSGIFFDAVGEPPVSEPPAPDLPAPDLPGTSTSLSATPVDGRFPGLAWTGAPGNQTGFRIERKTVATGEFEQIATVNADVTSYTDTDVSPSTTYLYRVLALGLSGGTDFSNEISITTSAGEVPSGAGNVDDSGSLGQANGSGGLPASGAARPSHDRQVPDAEVSEEGGAVPTSTALDLGIYALARIDGTPGQRFLIQIPDPVTTWKGLHVVTITESGYTYVVLDANESGPTLYRAIPLD